MPAGDAQRVWFPEMIAKLRSQYCEELSFEAIIELRAELDATLQRMRADRQIRPPVFKCPKCGHVGRGAEPHVSVRAMLCCLHRFGIVGTKQFKILERGWVTYRQQHRLDIYGGQGNPATRRPAAPIRSYASRSALHVDRVRKRFAVTRNLCRFPHKGLLARNHSHAG